MSKTVREKIALVIFLALIVFGGVIFAAYFTTGRSWSVAATIVDERVGSMDGYAAIVFAGSGDGDEAGAQKREPAEGSNTVSESDEAAVSYLGSSVFNLINQLVYYPGHKGVFVSDVAKIYLTKDADIFTLDMANPEKYANGEVFDVGDHKIGILYVPTYLTQRMLDARIQQMRNEGAHEIVCIAKRIEMLGGFDGIDVLLLDEPYGPKEDGREDLGSTVVLENPPKGQVGVAIFTSNGVPFVRTIEE